MRPICAQDAIFKMSSVSPVYAYENTYEMTAFLHVLPQMSMIYD